MSNTTLHDHLTKLDFAAFRQDFDRGANPNAKDMYGRNILEYAVFLVEDLFQNALCSTFSVDGSDSPIIFDAKAGASKKHIEIMNQMVLSMRGLTNVVRLLVADRRVSKKGIVSFFSTIGDPIFYTTLIHEIFNEHQPPPSAEVDIEDPDYYFYLVQHEPTAPRIVFEDENGQRTHAMNDGTSSNAGGSEFKGATLQTEKKTLDMNDPCDVRRLVNRVMDRKMKFHRHLEFLAALPPLVVELVDALGFKRFRPSPLVAQRLLHFSFVMDSTRMFRCCSRVPRLFCYGDLYNWDWLLFCTLVQVREYPDFFFLLLAARIKERIRASPRLRAIHRQNTEFHNSIAMALGKVPSSGEVGQSTLPNSRAKLSDFVSKVDVTNDGIFTKFSTQGGLSLDNIQNDASVYISHMAADSGTTNMLKKDMADICLREMTPRMLEAANVLLGPKVGIALRRWKDRQCSCVDRRLEEGPEGGYGLQHSGGANVSDRTVGRGRFITKRNGLGQHAL